MYRPPRTGAFRAAVPVEGPSARVRPRDEPQNSGIANFVSGPGRPPMNPDELVTVYGFKMWSPSDERYRVSRYKAPREVLAKYEVVVMETTGEAVPRADLDERGRYLPVGGPSVDSGWRSSSFDLASGLDVIEDPPDARPPGAAPKRP